MSKNPHGTDPYAERSFFADLVEIADTERSAATAIDLGARVEDNSHSEPQIGPRARLLQMHRVAQHEDVRERLDANKLSEMRALLDVSTPADRSDGFRADVTSGTFVPEGAPTRVRDALAGAVRARVVVAPLLENLDLPEIGMQVEEPRFTAGPTVGMHVEGSAVSNTDPTHELELVPVRTIAGAVNMSRTAFDRSDPALDEVIATELGTAYAELLEQQILNGAGTGQDVT